MVCICAKCTKDRNESFKSDCRAPGSKPNKCGSQSCSHQKPQQAPVCCKVQPVVLCGQSCDPCCPIQKPTCPYPGIPCQQKLVSACPVCYRPPRDCGQCCGPCPPPRCPSLGEYCVILGTRISPMEVNLAFPC